MTNSCTGDHFPPPPGVRQSWAATDGTSFESVFDFSFSSGNAVAFQTDSFGDPTDSAVSKQDGKQSGDMPFVLFAAAQD